MESLSLAAISAAVDGTIGAATTTLIGKVCEVGAKWLSTFFKDHHPKAIEKAKRNSMQFLANLAHNVNQKEEAAKDDEHIRGRIVSALEDPDFSAVLKDSLLISARTDQQDTHKVLARLVSERLHCKSGDLLALTIPLACDMAKALTGTQMRLLATKILVEELFLRYVNDLEPPMVIQRSLAWFEKKLSAILPKSKFTNTNLYHLECLSCVRDETRLGHRNGYIAHVLRNNLTLHDSSETQCVNDFLSQNELGKLLSHIWDSYRLSEFTSTYLGRLIGICVYYELTDDKADIRVIFPS